MSTSRGDAEPPDRCHAIPGWPDHASASVGSAAAATARPGRCGERAAAAGRAGPARPPGRRRRHPSARRGATRALDVEHECRAGGAQCDQAHPLVDPRVRPATNCFCRTKKTMSTGSATSTEPAEQVVVGEELTTQVVQRARDRQLVEALDQHRGPEELVVDPGRLQHGERRERRPDQRQGELPELTQHRGAVDLGRLVDLERQRLHVVASTKVQKPIWKPTLMRISPRWLSSSSVAAEIPCGIEITVQLEHRHQRRACGSSSFAARNTPSG